MTQKVKEIARNVQHDVEGAQIRAGIPECHRVAVSIETVETVLDALQDNDKAMEFLATA